MYLNQLKIYFFTIYNLKVRQVLFQFFRFLVPLSKPNLVKNKPFQSLHKIEFILPRSVSIVCHTIYVFDQPIYHYILQKFSSKCDFDYLYGFSFLYYDFIHLFESSSVVEDFLLASEEIKAKPNFHHPYVSSKRLINLVVLAQNNDGLSSSCLSEIVKQIHIDAAVLQKNIEYHVDANHLLTNFAALAVYDKYFGYDTEYVFFKRYLQEFELQFETGLHFERSISYTSQLLHEAFIVFQVFELNITDIIWSKVHKAIDSIRLFNLLRIKADFVDNIFEQSFDLDKIYDLYKKVLSRPISHEKFISPTNINDYLILFDLQFSACLDCGMPSPSYQPGHAHDSTGAIELSYKAKPIFISGNISTYEKNSQRLAERSRFNYSKVLSVGIFQNVWSSFRVAQRCRPEKIMTQNQIGCVLKNKSDRLTRTVSLNSSQLTIIDKVLLGSSIESQFIFSPSLSVSLLNNKSLVVEEHDIKLIMVFSGRITLERKTIASGYGKMNDTYVVKVRTQKDKSVVTISG